MGPLLTTGILFVSVLLRAFLPIVAQFESLAREFLPEILDLDFNETMISDESSLGDFCGWLETREAFDAWGVKVLLRIEERYGVRPLDSGILLVDLFPDIELHRRANVRQ